MSSTPSLPDVAIALLAADSAHALGGALVIAPGVEEAERWVTALRATLRAQRPAAPWRVVPSAVSEDRLVGGVDVVGTLASGVRIVTRGLLAEADDGVVVLPRAAAASGATLARLAAALDTGEVVPADATTVHPARVAVVAVATGADEQHEVAARLVERLALQVVLPSGYAPSAPDAHTSASASASDVAPEPAPAPVAALCAVADALGVDSSRAAVFAVRTARALARAAGRVEPSADDLAGAVQLVLAPRATRVPPADAAPATPPEPADDARPEERLQEQERQSEDSKATPEASEGSHDDVSTRELLIDAARAALPPNLIADASGGAAARAAAARGAAGRAAHGQRQIDDRRGRRVGTRPGHPRDGSRLDLVETLRTAAPWQRVRGRLPGGPLAVRTDDLRVERRRRPLGTTTVVVVDASGSAALGRLAEAKGAAELLLAESYARRDHVALVAFRGTEASVLLPPTRALARARRVVSALPAGGGTPLAAALVTATDLVRTVRRGGARPAVVLLTDGRANIALDGTPGRGRARTDALAGARALAVALQAAGGLAVVVDTAVRGGAEGRELAAAAGARYLALPHVSARALHGAIQTAIADGDPAPLPSARPIGV